MRRNGISWLILLRLIHGASAHDCVCVNEAPVTVVRGGIVSASASLIIWRSDASRIALASSSSSFSFRAARAVRSSA
eukprot:CAMPEP_0184385084 /NCGR_PEP_ID=MMETSP0007-20130409/8512_1 /TAXON_ID=97485 /ORGANISM="Prymnesium parvum, Strain Texoma1" /LENGTH=76 /DNA_ID=CAMNT_0026732259 /DNA_START=239 /DNA_END=469 /DNA_ORIENTATION=-